MMMMPVLVWCRSWQASALASLSICNNSFYSDSMYWILKTSGHLWNFHLAGWKFCTSLAVSFLTASWAIIVMKYRPYPFDQVDQEGHWCVYRGQEKPGQWGWRASCRACACSMPCTSATSLPPALGELEPRMVSDVKITWPMVDLAYWILHLSTLTRKRVVAFFPLLCPANLSPRSLFIPPGVIAEYFL